MLSVPCEVTISQIFRFSDQAKAKSFIEQTEEHHRSSTKRLDGDGRRSLDKGTHRPSRHWKAAACARCAARDAGTDCV
ncbi:hypothetical protein ACFS07_32870 [Undibacterium arcticum]